MTAGLNCHDLSTKASATKPLATTYGARQARRRWTASENCWEMNNFSGWKCVKTRVCQSRRGPRSLPLMYLQHGGSVWVCPCLWVFAHRALTTLKRALWKWSGAAEATLGGEALQFIQSLSFGCLRETSLCHDTHYDLKQTQVEFTIGSRGAFVTSRPSSGLSSSLSAPFYSSFYK